MNGKITLPWGDGDHDFNIAKIGLVLELEEKCGIGVYEIFQRIRESRWKFNDVRESVRLGLIGGGKTPVEALVLTKRYVDEQPWQDNVHVALAVLMAAIVGVPGDEVGKEPAEGTTTEATAASSAPPSTVAAQPLAGPRAKSTRSPSGSSPRRSTGGTKRTVQKKHPRPQPEKSMRP